MGHSKGGNLALYTFLNANHISSFRGVFYDSLFIRIAKRPDDMARIVVVTHDWRHCCRAYWELDIVNIILYRIGF